MTRLPFEPVADGPEMDQRTIPGVDISQIAVRMLHRPNQCKHELANSQRLRAAKLVHLPPRAGCQLMSLFDKADRPSICNNKAIPFQSYTFCQLTCRLSRSPKVDHTVFNWVLTLCTAFAFLLVIIGLGYCPFGTHLPSSGYSVLQL